MDAISFVYWLQGYLELSAADSKTPEFTKEQVECIKRHIALVLMQVPGIQVSPISFPSGWPWSTTGTTPIVPLCDKPICTDVTFVSGGEVKFC